MSAQAAAAGTSPAPPLHHESAKPGPTTATARTAATIVLEYLLAHGAEAAAELLDARLSAQAESSGDDDTAGFEALQKLLGTAGAETDVLQAMSSVAMLPKSKR